MNYLGKLNKQIFYFLISYVIDPIEIEEWMESELDCLWKLVSV